MRVLLILILMSWGTAASAEGRIALVIGNAQYANVGLLNNPVSDAASVTEALTEQGFEVTALTDLGYGPMKAAMKEFRDRADRAEVALVYFAGHGIEVGGVNYLLPTDARLNDERDAADEGISLDFVLNQIAGARKLKMVVLDSCRNNPFKSRMVRRGLKRDRVSDGYAKVETAVPDTLIAYAAAAGETTPDGTGKNSPFTAAFVEALTGPPVDVRLLFGAIRDIMREAVPDAEPFVYTSLGGSKPDYVINPRSGVRPPPITEADYAEALELLKRLKIPLGAGTAAMRDQVSTGLKAFQAELGYPTTGRPDSNTLMALRFAAKYLPEGRTGSTSALKDLKGFFLDLQPTRVAVGEDAEREIRCSDEAGWERRRRACTAALRSRAWEDAEAAKFYNVIGIANAKLDQPLAALTAFDAAIRLDPRQILYFKNRGKLHLRRSALKESLADYQHALTLGQDDADLKIIIATIRRDLGEVDSVFTEWESALTAQIRKSRGSTRILNRWQSHLKEKGLFRGEIDGKYKQTTRAALAACARSKECQPLVEDSGWGLISPPAADVPTDLALADPLLIPDTLAPDRSAGAGRCTQQGAPNYELFLCAAALKSREWTSHETAIFENAMGTLHAKMGNMEAAVVQFGNAIDRAEPDEVYFQNMGRALHALGRHSDALDNIEAALTLAPKSGRLIAYRGNIRKSIGHTDAATTDWETAIALPLDDRGTPGIRALQVHLRAHGHYTGPIDGDYGPGSRAALRDCAIDPNCRLDYEAIRLEWAHRTPPEAPLFEPKNRIREVAREALENCKPYKGERERAMKACNEAIASGWLTTEELIQAYETRAFMHEQFDNNREAAVDLAALLRLRQEKVGYIDYSLMFSLGRVMWKLGEYRKAVDNLEIVKIENVDVSEFNKVAGFAYAGIRQPVTAVQYWESTLGRLERNRGRYLRVAADWQRRLANRKFGGHYAGAMDGRDSVELRRALKACARDPRCYRYN